jgi:hypothetical protein
MQNTKSFLKNNWFKISMIIAVVILLLLVFLAIFYFYNLYKNNLDKNYYQQQTEKCAELSSQYIKDNYNNSTHNQSLSTFNPAQYHFNKKLNTCLVFADGIIISSDSNNFSESSLIVDLLTNKNLIRSFYLKYNGEITTVYTGLSSEPIEKAAWEKQKQELMSE